MVIRKVSRSMSRSSSVSSSRRSSVASSVDGEGSGGNGSGGNGNGNSNGGMEEGEGNGIREQGLSFDASNGEAPVRDGEIRKWLKMRAISACLDGYDDASGGGGGGGSSSGGGGGGGGGSGASGGGRGFEVDLWRLRDLCLTEGGLVNAELRQRAWHKLLGINASAMDDPENDRHGRIEADDTDAASIDQEEMGLIRRDVGRSVYFRFFRADGNGGGSGGGGGGGSADAPPPSRSAMAAAAAAVPASASDEGEADAEEETRESATVSTCGSTLDATADDPTTRSINQAATRLRAVSLSSDMTTDSNSCCGTGLDSPMNLSDGPCPPCVADGADEERSDTPGAAAPTAEGGESGDGDGTAAVEGADCADEDGSSRETKDWERQNMLMSLILSAIAPRRTESYAASARSSSDANEGATAGRLHYYQGFHDVASVVLLQMGPDRPQLSSAILRKLARHHLRDNMREDFDVLTASLESAFLPLLHYFDEAVHDFLTHCGLNSASILSWILTWFSHDVHDADTAGRLFDAFLASHPAMPVYLAVATVAHPAHRRMLFANECCPAMIHVAVGGLLGAVGGSSLDWSDEGEAAEGVVTFQDLIDDAISFMRKVPPSTLNTLAKRYRALSNASGSPRFRRRAGNHDPIPRSSALVRPPPSWCTAPSATADWVLDQQRRQTLQQRRGGGQLLPSRGKLISASIKRQYYCYPSNISSLLKAPSPNADGNGVRYKEENFKAKAAAGLAPDPFCDDDAEMLMMQEERKTAPSSSSSSLSSSSSSSAHSSIRRRPIRTSARNAAGAFGNLVKNIRISAQRSRIESG